MHIASGLALVKRNPAQSDVAGGRKGVTWLRWRRMPDQATATPGRLRKILPGAILLAVLALLGALFPMLF